MDRLRAHMSYSNVMATIAVFVALGGGAYAASNAFESSSGAIKGCVPKRGGGLRVVKPGSACPHGYLTLTFAARGPRGLQGSQGPQGSQGAPGANGTNATGGPSTPTGPAGGDLTGTYPDPTLAAAPAPATVSINTMAPNNWTQESGSTYGPLQCYEDRAGFVHLQGAVIAPGTGVAVTSALPSECPPPALRRAYMIPISTANFGAVDAGNLRVEPTGALLVQDGGTNPPASDVVSLDGVTWRVR